MAGEPGADLVLLVRGVVVEDDVDGLVRRHLALDAVEEADELLMAVALHVLCDDRTVQHAERVGGARTQGRQLNCNPMAIPGHASSGADGQPLAAPAGEGQPGAA